MTKEEYDVEYNALQQRFYDDVKKLRIRYAKANQKFHVGDIIRHGFSELRVIVIEKTTISLGYNGRAEIKYTGHRILKNGNLAKRDTKIDIYESDAMLIEKGGGAKYGIGKEEGTRNV
jgi:hypothetical protein